LPNPLEWGDGVAQDDLLDDGSIVWPRLRVPEVD
jgi:hypothetical protein